jgi:hypothetical protein
MGSIGDDLANRSGGCAGERGEALAVGERRWVGAVNAEDVAAPCPRRTAGLRASHLLSPQTDETPAPRRCSRGQPPLESRTSEKKRGAHAPLSTRALNPTVSIPPPAMCSKHTMSSIATYTGTALSPGHAGERAHPCALLGHSSSTISKTVKCVEKKGLRGALC